MMVVEADDVDGLALEKVILRRGLVAASRDGTRNIVFAHNIGKMVCQQGVHAHLALTRQGRGVAAGIENEVGLLESQRIGLG